LFLEKDNKVISPFHDVPLFANEEKTVSSCPRQMVPLHFHIVSFG
jgi:hypothetical protein